MTVLDDSAERDDRQAENVPDGAQVTSETVLSQLRELSKLFVRSRMRTRRGNSSKDERRSDDDVANAFDCLSADELAQLSAYLQRVIDSAEDSMTDDEYAERRRAMREYLSLKHQGAKEGDLDE